MVCEHCQAALEDSDIVCPQCGEPVVRHFNGFESTYDIQKSLKAIVEQFGSDIMHDPTQFVAYLNDCLPDYDRERRLLRNALENNILTTMLKEKDNQRIAIAKAKEYMSNEMFLCDPASEFVICCFTYMLEWDYTPVYSAPMPAQSAKSSAQPAKQQANQKKTKIYRSSDARLSKFKGNITISEDYTGIDNFCFDGFTFMRSITLPDGMLSIGEYAFSECKRLKKVEMPSTVRIIKQGAFSSCAKLAAMYIPMGVTEIADSTFSFCGSLEVVEIPQSVGTIGVEAFSGCDSLKKLFIPDSVKYIDPSAFSYCSQLTIRCVDGSFAHRFAIENNIRYELVSKNGSYR